MKQKDPLVYGVIGALLGGIIIWFLTANAVNTNQLGMMQMMGIRSNTINTPQQFGTGMMGNIDRHFIEQMIPHHQDAITMAEIALKKAQHPEIKKLAENIKKTQTDEITKMRSWYKKWYGVAVPKDSDRNNYGVGMMGQMHGGMMGNDTDVNRLENAQDFDKAFIEEMIPHHQMAVMMGNMLKYGTAKPEMRGLADDIISAQTKEIEQMRQWYKEWGY